MALPSDIHPFHLAGAGQGYQVANSLRFRASNSAYLSRTPSVTSNRRTFTYSIWTKLGLIPNAGWFFGADDGTLYSQFGIESDSKIYFNYIPNTGGTVYRIGTSGVFRDPSSWYHIVWSIDTTQATNTNRIKIYINGVQQTLSDLTGYGYPPQNTDTHINQNLSSMIGRFIRGANNQFDGYLAEVNFIDGQALTPSSFGQTDNLTNQWVPKKYTGTYGTNGFYLPFNDATSTTTIGYDRQLGMNDSSKNNWTPSGISVTSGTTYDSMRDSPTAYNDGSTTYNRGNYATLNPVATRSTLTLSNGNLSVTMNSTNANCVAPATLAIPVGQKGKYYWEMFCSAQTGDNNFGLVNENYNFLTDRFDIYNSSANSLSWYGAQSGGVFLGNTRVATLVDWSASGASWVACAVDGETGKIWFALNGTWQGSGDPGSGANPAYTWSSSKLLFPAFRPYTGAGAVYSVNFGQRPFNYTPPSGFTTLNTYNLANPSLPLV